MKKIFYGFYVVFAVVLIFGVMSLPTGGTNAEYPLPTNAPITPTPTSVLPDPKSEPWLVINENEDENGNIYAYVYCPHGALCDAGPFVDWQIILVNLWQYESAPGVWMYQVNAVVCRKQNICGWIDEDDNWVIKSNPLLKSGYLIGEQEFIQGLTQMYGYMYLWGQPIITTPEECDENPDYCVNFERIYMKPLAMPYILNHVE